MRRMTHAPPMASTTSVQCLQLNYTADRMIYVGHTSVALTAGAAAMPTLGQAAAGVA